MPPRARRTQHEKPAAPPAPERPRRRSGLLLVLAIVLLGLVVQVLLARWSGSSLLAVSLAVLALAPLVAALAGVVWLVQRLRSRV